jgi:hypothetical protein
VLGVLLLLAGAGVGIALAAGAFKTSTNTVVKKLTPGGSQSAPAISADDVRHVLSAYEAAYSNRNLSALDAMFAPDFKRRAPPRPDMGRAQALDEYRRQFANLSNPHYALANESIETGPQGATATADYTITDGNSQPASGTIAFALTVTNGKLLIDAIDIRSG